MAVFVLDKHGKALMPCTEKRARLLLERGRARVHRLVPMVIRLIDRQADDCEFQALRLKLDPGSKTTGLALVRETATVVVLTGEIQQGVAVLNLLELVHRGRQISEALTARRQMRRRRRGNLRFRAPRFLNRGNKQSGCRVVQRNDGYGYFLNPAIHTGREKVRPEATNALHSALYLPGMNAGVSRAF